jgi:hypothetical protein
MSVTAWRARDCRDCGTARAKAAALLQVSCVSVVQVSCNKVKKMRYAPSVTRKHRAPAPAPGTPAHRPSIALLTFPDARFDDPDTLRLADPCKPLSSSTLPITEYYVRHMERGFYSVKPAIGGAGGRPVITTATATHSPPQTFFRQLAPFALACTRRHATFPYVVQDTSASVFPFWGARWPH